MKTKDPVGGAQEPHRAGFSTVSALAARLTGERGCALLDYRGAKPKDRHCACRAFQRGSSVHFAVRGLGPDGIACRTSCVGAGTYDRGQRLPVVLPDPRAGWADLAHTRARTVPRHSSQSTLLPYLLVPTSVAHCWRHYSPIHLGFSILWGRHVSISEDIKTSETTRDLVYLAYDRASNGVIASELEKAGYRIRFTSSIGETIFCLRGTRYVALIVGPLVQANDKTLLASELKRRNSATKIVFLHRDGQKSNGAPGIADAVLNVQSAADTVVRTLKKLLAPK